MARRCKVCSSLDRIRIDQALKDGVSTSKLSTQFSISEDSLTRHRTNHVQVTSITTSSTSDMLRDLISSYEALERECRLKADLYGVRVAMNNRRECIAQLAELELKNPELRKSPGMEQMSIELIDSIVQSVRLSYDECPHCHQTTIPKVKGIPRRPLMN